MNTEQLEWIWSGNLEVRGAVPVTRKPPVPQLWIGKPVWWDDSKILGETWIPPVGGARYGLARFALGLDMTPGGILSHLDFKLTFKGLGQGAAPTVFDLYPRSISEAHTSTVKAGLGPEVKAPGGVEFKLTQIEATETLQWVAPAVTAWGIGMSQARWACTERDTRPLIGQQLFYAVIALPAGISAVRVTLDITVEVQIGPALLRAFLPTAVMPTVRHFQLPPA